MERVELAAILAAADEAERTKLLEQHAALLDAGLAHALRVCYLEAVGGNPALAAGAAATLGELSSFTEDSETHALADWTNGLAALQLDGRPETAIPLIDAAGARFLELGRQHLHASTQVSKVYALALLGRYDEALAAGEQARDVFLAHGDRLAAGRIEQNLGNIYHRRDRYESAAARYDAAREHFAAVGDGRLMAFAENGLANVLALQHDFEAAARLYEQALARATSAQDEVTSAEIECNLGCLALSQGRYDQALEYLELSRQRYDGLGMPHQSVLAELELADAYLELNMADEAALIYARTSAALAELGMRAEQARALTHFARACVVLARLDQAKVLTTAAQALYAEEENDVGVALATLTEAQALLASGQWMAAEERATAAEETLSAAGAWGNLLHARWLRGEALRLLLRHAEARALLKETLHLAEQRSVLQVEYRCHAALGLIADASGDSVEAEAELTRAVLLVEAMRAPLPAEELRLAFIADKLDPYADLARLCLADSAARAPEALAFVERARARELLASLRSEQLSDEAQTTIDPELRARHESVRQELNWFYSQINRLPDAEMPPSPEAMAKLWQGARERETSLKELERRIWPARSQAVNFEFDLDELQRQLGHDTVLVEYYRIGNELMAFVIADGQLHTVRNLATEEQVTAALEQLRFQIGALRHSSLGLRAHTGQLERRARRHLAQLYDLLLRPLEPLLGERNLVIAPHRMLYYVPFHALHDGERYVVERCAVSYTPSAQIFLHGATRVRRPLRSALLMGVPDEQAPRLQDEVVALAEHFEEARLKVGAQATVAAFRELAPAVDVIHMACHGQFRMDNPLFSYLQLADGRLVVRDAVRMRLHAELAVLSACETGLSTVAPGDELLGLARGFFAAGVPSLIVSLWAVDDQITADLMGHLYQELRAGQELASALRSAQLAILQQEQHPFFWAPFILLGRR